MAEFASSTPMKASQGNALEHPVTELEAVRSVLVQGLPILDQELTESSVVQVFSAYGEISKLLLQTHESNGEGKIGKSPPEDGEENEDEDVRQLPRGRLRMRLSTHDIGCLCARELGKTQRAVVVFVEVEAAVAALQANGRDILGSNCAVALASTMPTVGDRVLGGENVSDEPETGAADGASRRPKTAAEWLRHIFSQGVVYTRLFDEKLRVSETARGLAAKARAFDETHNVSSRMVAAASTAGAKAREVDTRLGVSETAQKWARSAKESADKAMENPRVASGVQQTNQAISGVVRQMSGLAQQALDSARGQTQPPAASGDASTPTTTKTAQSGS